MNPDAHRDVGACMQHANGAGGGLLELPAGGSRRPASPETASKNQHTIKMNGREVFRFATTVLADATREVVDQAGPALDDVALVIPHQVSNRIIQTAARRLKMPPERFFVNLERYGNTSSGLILITLCGAIEEKQVKPADNDV
jgi:3-oxoacyl-[acyl-carrier-protein] synthase-3